MKNLFYPLIVLALLCGCTSREEANNYNERGFRKPELVGEMRQGKLYRVKVIVPSELDSHDHWVYWFEGPFAPSTVTLNQSQPSGKTTYNQVIVIDNKQYELVPKH